MAKVFFACIFTVCFALSLSATGVWIDTDPSIGSPIREVDDAFALVLAFHSPELRIFGISTTYGNATLDRTTRVARDMVTRFGRDTGLMAADVFPGARSGRDIGKQTAATEALHRTLQRNRKITYIALGPLTNLASFLGLHPTRARQIECVVIIGGRSPTDQLAFGPNNFLRIHDANVIKDSVATRAVLNSGVPVLLVPVPVSAQLTVSRPSLAKIGQCSPAGAFLQRHSGVWSWFWTDMVRMEGGPVFDAVAILAVARPDFLRRRSGFARFDSPQDLVVRPIQSPGSRRVQACTAVASQSSDFVESRLCSRPR